MPLNRVMYICSFSLCQTYVRRLLLSRACEGACKRRRVASENLPYLLRGMLLGLARDKVVLTMVPPICGDNSEDESRTHC